MNHGFSFPTESLSTSNDIRREVMKTSTSGTGMSYPSPAHIETLQEQRFSSFLEAAPDGVVIIDQCGRIVRVNGQTEVMFGYGRAELLGQDVEILMPERFRGSHRGQRSAFMAHPSTRPMGPSLELWGLRKDGSEFIVRLPIRIQPRQEPPPRSTGPAASALSGCRILVVDDNVDSADIMEMFLRRKGNDIRIAHDGLAALEAAETFHPEFMLLDIGLPKLNGYEVARRVRQQSWGRDAILVALTGWGQDEDKVRSLEAGFNFHMVKPVSLAALEELLTGCVQTAAGH